jgi:hypothetical protein
MKVTAAQVQRGMHKMQVENAAWKSALIRFEHGPPMTKKQLQAFKAKVLHKHHLAKIQYEHAKLFYGNRTNHNLWRRQNADFTRLKSNINARLSRV